MSPRNHHKSYYDRAPSAAQRHLFAALAGAQLFRSQQLRASTGTRGAAWPSPPHRNHTNGGFILPDVARGRRRTALASNRSRPVVALDGSAVLPGEQRCPERRQCHKRRCRARTMRRPAPTPWFRASPTPPAPSQWCAASRLPPAEGLCSPRPRRARRRCSRGLRTRCSLASRTGDRDRRRASITVSPPSPQL